MLTGLIWKAFIVKAALRNQIFQVLAVYIAILEMVSDFPNNNMIWKRWRCDQKPYACRLFETF